jgi:hypothetical protein
MMLERLKRLLIGGTVLAALALGSSAAAGAATASSGATSARAALQRGSGRGPSTAFTSTRTSGTPARENAEKTLTGDAASKPGRLSDHEQ